MDLNNLHVCAEYNDLGNALRLIAQGDAVNGRDRQERTPLHWAAMYAHTRMCDLLYLNGAQLTFSDAEGKTPRDLAPTVARRWFQAVENRAELGRQDPASGLRDAIGRTELHWAALHGDATRIRSLLQAGADPSVSDEHGRTPLYYAAMAGSGSAVEALAGEHALALEATDCRGQTAVHAAMVGKNRVALESLLRHNSFFAHGRDRKGATALMTAAETGWTEGVQRMAEAGCWVDESDEAGSCALLRAAEHGHAEACRALLALGADAGARDMEENTALDLAVHALSPETASAVLDSWLEREPVPPWVSKAIAQASRRLSERADAIRAADAGRNPGSRGERAAVLMNLLDPGTWTDERQARLAVGAHAPAIPSAGEEAAPS